MDFLAPTFERLAKPHRIPTEGLKPPPAVCCSRPTPPAKPHRIPTEGLKQQQITADDMLVERAKPHRIPTEGLKHMSASRHGVENIGLNPTESRPRD